MRKKKLTKKERKEQREALARRRFYESTVVKCFLCGTWQLLERRDAEVWECCCGAGGTIGQGMSETMQVSEFLIDEWTDRVARFWTGEEIEQLGIALVGIANLQRSANPATLFQATVETWDHLNEGCDCWTDEQRAIATEVHDLQRVDWHKVSDAIRLGKTVAPTRDRTGAGEHPTLEWPGSSDGQAHTLEGG